MLVRNRVANSWGAPVNTGESASRGSRWTLTPREPVDDRDPESRDPSTVGGPDSVHVGFPPKRNDLEAPFTGRPVPQNWDWFGSGPLNLRERPPTERRVQGPGWRLGHDNQLATGPPHGRSAKEVPRIQRSKFYRFRSTVPSAAEITGRILRRSGCCFGPTEQAMKTGRSKQ